MYPNRKSCREKINFECQHYLTMGVTENKTNENSGDKEIFYNERKVKISELTNEEKIDCISRLWLYKENMEGEKEVLQEMIQKMYFFGKMEKLEKQEND